MQVFKNNKGSIMNQIIAVDIGGVIRTKNEHASIETDNYLEAPVVPGAKKGLAFLIEHFGAETVHLVSRCRLSKQKRSLEWLEHNGIFALGILRENVHLCVGMNAKIKKLKELQAHISNEFNFIVIDDRREVFEKLDRFYGIVFITELPEISWRNIILGLSPIFTAHDRISKEGK
jgi:hypothetical protein